MQIGLESFSYHLAFALGRMDIFGFLRRTADLGLDGVQINVVRGPVWGHLGGDSRDHLEKVRAMARELGLFIEIDTRGTDPGHLSQALDVCHALGADVLRTFVSLGGDMDEELRRAPDDLRRVLPRARDLGIRLALENHEYETAADMIELLERIDSPQVGLLVDVGNSMMALEDPLAAVRAMAPYAVSTHFKDHVVISGDDDPRVVAVPIGMGNIDCAECLRILMAASILDRINIEESYGYSAPFRYPLPAQDTLEWLGPAFRCCPPPHDPGIIAPFLYESVPAGAEERFLDFQDRAVRHSVEQMKRIVRLVCQEPLSPETGLK